MPSPAVSQRVDDRLRELYERHLRLDESEVAGYYASGRDYDVATYYESGRGLIGPEPGAEMATTFGISVIDLDGDLHSAGDHDVPFALQSISKVFAYGLALDDRGRDHVLRHVGVEPSGDAFSSISFDERHHRPHNPMVNAGALVTTTLVRGRDQDERLERILEVMRAHAGNPSLEVDPEIFERELATADRNRATAYLMRSEGMLTGDVEEELALYLKLCSVKVTCDDLATMAATLANSCVCPSTGEQVLSRATARDVLSVMYTCGMYDFAGQWAFEVGVPAKSGVSGGVLAAIPGKMGLAVFSPGLDPYGNSVRGTRVCREVSGRLGLHVFAGEGDDALLGSAVPAA